MRILHAPKNIAGQASTLSRSQRQLGVTSDIFVFNENNYCYPSDFNLRINLHNPFHIITAPLRIIGFFIWSLNKYDIYHFHYGWSFLPMNVDILILRVLGKKVVMHYWGSDIIQTDIANRYTNLSMEKLNEIYPAHNNTGIRRRIERIRRWANLSLVGSPALLPYSPNSRYTYPVIDIKKYSPVKNKIHKNINIIHAPTNREIKGTQIVIDTILKLKKDGYPINFVLIENKKHNEAVKIYKKADIIIDDILEGPYGILSLECMALGKPVLVYIHKNILPYIPFAPIINTNPDNLRKNIIKLINNPHLRHNIGKQSIMFVKKYHNAGKIANELINMYKEL